MAIITFLKEELNINTDNSNNIEGDPKELVNSLVKYAPGEDERIGYILKYAANSDPEYNIWDMALDYFENGIDKDNDEGASVPHDDENELTDNDESEEKTNDDISVDDDIFNDGDDESESEDDKSDSDDTSDSIEM